MATKPDQHRIDEAARRLLHEIVDDISWTIKTDPDYGFDYRVQMFSGNSLSWQVFLIQLKGHRRCKHIKHRDGYVVSQIISRDRLCDYADVYREPVFVVVVDTTAKSAYYLFIQEYIDGGRLPTKWRRQSSSVVHVPVTNDFAKRDSFAKDLASALKYMNDKYPGSVEAALQKAKREYVKIDPRFDVAWEFRDGKPAPRFIPRESVSLRISISARGDDASSRLSRLVNSGLPTEFTRDEVKLIGSPLLERALDAEKVTLQFAHSHEVLVSLIRTAADGRETARLDGLRGSLTAGQQEYSFSARLPNDILSVHVDSIAQKGGPAPIRLSLDMSSWFTTTVRAMPYFDSLHAFFVDHCDCSVKVKVLHVANGMSQTHELGDMPSDAAASMKALLSLIRKMRRIAEIMQIDPVMKDKLTDDDVMDILRVYRLLTEGPQQTVMKNGRFTLTLGRDGATAILREQRIDNLSLNGIERTEFFRTPFESGTTTRVISGLHVQNREAVQSALNDASKQDFVVVLEAVGGSTILESIVVSVPDKSPTMQSSVPVTRGTPPAGAGAAPEPPVR